MSCWALIPLKATGQGKVRLAVSLSPGQRRQLVEQMFDHVIDTLHLAKCIDGIAVTSPEPAGRGVLWLKDSAGELNSALGNAASELLQLGATELVVLHADLPELGVADVETLVAEGRRQGVAFAPDHRGRGTNALFTRLPSPVRFRFGSDSLERHLQETTRSRVMPAIVRRPGLACDVDVPGDLRKLSWAPDGHEFQDYHLAC